MSAIDDRPSIADACRACRNPRSSAQDPAVGGDRGMGRGRRLPHGDRRLRVQPRAAAALHLHRVGGCQHRTGPPHALRDPGLAAVRVGPRRLRPQQGGGRAHRTADDVALAGRRGPLVVLRRHADGVAAGTHQAAVSAVVGSRPQHRLHVVLHPAVRGGGRAVAARPRRVEGVRQAVRRAVVRGAGDLRAAARRAAVGRVPLHRRRRRGRSVRPEMHVPVGARRSRRRPPRRDANHPGRRQRLDRADRRPRVGQAAICTPPAR